MKKPATTMQAFPKFTAAQRAELEVHPFAATSRDFRADSAKAEPEARAIVQLVETEGYWDAIKHLEANPPSARAIAFLVFVAHEYMQREQVRKGAEVANRKRVKAREQARRDWLATCAQWESKQEFAESYRTDVRKRHGIEVSTKTVVDVWLKGLPAAGGKRKPDR